MCVSAGETNNDIERRQESSASPNRKKSFNNAFDTQMDSSSSDLTLETTFLRFEIGQKTLQ